MASNDVSVGGTGWIFPENAGLEDSNRGIAEMQFGDSSYYLRALGFGFAVPRTSRISGVTLDIKRSAEGPDAIRDYSVRLVTGGKPAGAEYAKEERWPAQDEFMTYGNGNDLWETAITPDDVNNGSFGVVIAARNGGSKLAPSAQLSQQAAAPQPAASMPKTASAEGTAGPEDIGALIKLAEKEKRGRNVERLQGALIRAARGPAADELATFGATGHYGPVTQRAVAEWKKPNGIQNVPAVKPAAASITPAAQPQPAPATEVPAVNAGNAQAIKTPLVRGDKDPDVAMLQRLIIKLNAGPEALVVAGTGATGVYGWRTERAVAELQDAITQAMKGPEAWKLAHALFKYGKGSWGELTKAATIEYLGSLR